VRFEANELELQTLVAISTGPVGAVLVSMIRRHQALLDSEARMLDAPGVFRALGAAAVLVEIAAAIEGAHDNLAKFRRMRQDHDFRHGARAAVQ